MRLPACAWPAAGNWMPSNRCATACKAEPELVIVFGDAIKGEAVRRLVDFGESLGIPVRYVCLLDYSNSRGAVDMGLLPDAAGGLALPEIVAARRSGRVVGGGGQPAP